MPHDLTPRLTCLPAWLAVATVTGLLAAMQAAVELVATDKCAAVLRVLGQGDKAVIRPNDPIGTR